MYEFVPSMIFGRDYRRESQIPHVTTNFSNRRSARDRNVSIHRTVLGTADDCAEIDVGAGRIKSDCDAEPCAEWNGGSGCREASIHHGKGGGAGNLKPVGSGHLSRVA